MRKCYRCKKVKNKSDFYKGCTYCKECTKDRARKHYQENREKLKNKKKEWRKNNPERQKETSLKWWQDNPDYYKNNPWIISFKSARSRCNNPNDKSYQWYGGRGIKCNMTNGDFKELWFRDKAYDLKKPTVDRIDNDGNYEILNCRYIEQIDNLKKANERKHKTIDKKG